MRHLARVCALALVASFVMPAAGAQVGANVVRVTSFAFDPFDIRIEPGEEVTWFFEDGGHAVVADDGRFDFDPGQPVNTGQTRSFTFSEDEVLGYYCRYHGRPGKGMWGRVIVGDATVPTPDPGSTPPPPPVREVPSEEFPHVAAALEGAEPGTIVEIAPGTYTQGNLRVAVPDLAIRGTGSSPADVVFDGTARDHAFEVVASGVRIENLTVSGFREDGIAITAATDFVIEDVIARDNRTRGITVSGSRTGIIRDVTASGSGEAGIAVRGCADCDIVVEGAEAHGNAIGYLGVNTGGVVVRRSGFSSNRTGVVVASHIAEEGPPGRGTHLVDNTITSNDGSLPTPRGFAATPGAPQGVGVWMASGWFDVVEGNTVNDHARYGVVATTLGLPSVADRVVANTISGSGAADLAWDGIGLNVCFDGNTAGSTTPPQIQTLYPCGTITAGVPQPQVTAEVLLAGR